jgi:DNA-binding CsgD family transcriptional regulator
MMNSFNVGSAIPGRRPDSSALPDIVEAMGTANFGSRLVAYLHAMCGADHCAVFQLGPDSICEVASGSIDGTQKAHDAALRYVGQQYWRKDPTISEARSRVLRLEAAIIRVDIGELVDADLRDAVYPQIRERLLLCGRRNNAAFGLSILRTETHGRFSDDEITELASAAELLVSLLAKHADVMLGRPNLADALTSLVDIESCLVAETDLPRRELEVCSRVLYGLSTAGVALDLGIGEESVKTYRKRAYQRLEIGSERELLTWYLHRWSEWRSHAAPVVRSSAAPWRHHAAPMLTH